MAPECPPTAAPRLQAPIGLAVDARLRQFTTLLQNSQDAIVIVDREGRICEWSPAAEALFGWTRKEALKAQLQRYVPEDERVHFEQVWNDLATGGTVLPYEAVRLHRSGARRPVNVRVAAVQMKGRFAGAVTTLSERTKPARQGPLPAPRQPMPEVDGLSGLCGRGGLQRGLAEPVAEGLCRAVAVLDVDGFALVNQTYGPDVGDDVLRELGRRLSTVAGASLVGRWQADEFVCVLDAPDAGAGMRELTEAALQAVRVPLLVGGDVLHVTVSVGAVVNGLAPEEDLLRAATEALHAAKEAGRDRAVWFTPELRPAAEGGLRLANDLHRGIANHELRLHYQPIVDLQDNRVVAVEALVRWERPGIGLLAPAAFIDVAERTGQVVQLGAWVARVACQAAVELAALPSGPFSVSINLSARQLNDPGVVEMLRTALSDSGCLPGSIVIEVTETALMHDLVGATATLQVIKNLGVSIALDDFGTGYSSLLYLRHFPVDHIKIDQSFVQGLGTNAADTAIVASTISLAHSVGVKAVAEGVETDGQLALLRQLGCDFGQGYLFSRPLPLEQLRGWLPDADVVREPTHSLRILQLHREGASLHSIAASLNVDGLRCDGGSRWSATSVAKVIAQLQAAATRIV